MEVGGHYDVLYGIPERSNERERDLNQIACLVKHQRKVDYVCVFFFITPFSWGRTRNQESRQISTFEFFDKKTKKFFAFPSF